MITSNKRPLSPESTNGHLTTDQRALKRFKLHSIIQELRNEEANLVILKKLRSSQQIGTRQTTASTSNGHHSNTAARTLPPTKSAPTSTSRSANPSVVPAATRKPTVPAASLPVALPSSKIPTMPTKSSPNVSNSTLVSSNQISLEERKAQAKNALRLKLERDLLNIPAPKPLLQDIFFVPNPNSLEFQPYIGLEDVVQCLYELQNDRHRLPQRFTDRAQVDEPYVCDQCGTDYTIRWWKHLNNSNSQTNILCDRCKKQVTRRTLKSEHSALLKSVFVSAIEQEKEIDKSFHALIKQQQKVSNSATRSSPSTTPASSKIPAVARPPATYLPPNSTLPNPSKPKAKSSVPSAQNFATKLSQQAPVNATRKSNVVPPSAPPVSHPSTMKSPMATHHSSSSSPQQQFRNATSLTAQQAKQFQMAKMPKNATRQASALSVATGATPSARANFLPTGTPLIPPTNPATALAAAAAALAGIPPSLLAASTHPTMRPTATKRRT